MPATDVPFAPGLPFVGQLLEIRRDRVGVMRRLARDYGGAVQIRVGMFKPFFFASPELAHEVLVEHSDAFMKAPALSVFARPLLGRGLLTSEDALHKRQRRMLAPVFVQRRVAKYAEVMADRTERAQARWADGAELDVAEEMMRLTLEIVGKTLFDAEVGADAEEINAAVTEGMGYVMGAVSSLVPVPPFLPTPGNLRNRRVIAGLDAIVYRMIRERRESGEDRGDLLSMMLAARGEDGESRMDDQQIRDEALTLLLAGHETTANALAWSLYLVSRSPEVRERLEAEVDGVLDGPPTIADLARLPYTLAVLKEAMRLYPPAYGLTRLATRPVKVGGIALARGAIVVVNVLGMHHSTRYFSEPERFEPERFLGEAEQRIPRGAYLPFGAGPRICIGNHFALMEGQISLAGLVRRVRLELVPGQTIEPEPLMTLRPRGGIRMRVRRREGAPARERARGVGAGG